MSWVIFMFVFFLRYGRNLGLTILKILLEDEHLTLHVY